MSSTSTTFEMHLGTLAAGAAQSCSVVLVKRDYLRPGTHVRRPQRTHT